MNNKKSRLFAYKIRNVTDSEIVQRLASTFGYKWYEDDNVNKIEVLSYGWLVFDPDMKQVIWANNINYIESNVNVAVECIESLLSLFISPPMIIYQKIFNDNITLYSNGVVIFKNNITLSTNEFEKLYSVRKEFINDCNNNKNASTNLKECAEVFQTC